MIRTLLIAMFLTLIAAPASAQFLISDTSRMIWTASPDHDSTILDNYRIEMWPTTAVIANVPQGPPAVTLNVGKPAKAANGEVQSPLIKPSLKAGVNYVVLLSATGPGGQSTKVGYADAGGALLPFVVPAPPGAASGVRFTP